MVTHFRLPAGRLLAEVSASTPLESMPAMVLQEIARNPDVRILLSRQTHMAVDNALARIHAVRPDLSCVRLGKDSDRIAHQSRTLLLENVAKRWRKTLTDRCDKALADYGQERGVDIERLRALENQLLASREDIASNQIRAEKAESALAACGDLGREMMNRPTSGSKHWAAAFRLHAHRVAGSACGGRFRRSASFHDPCLPRPHYHRPYCSRRSRTMPRSSVASAQEPVDSS